MKTWRRIVTTVLAMSSLCLALGAGAAEPKEGRDFQRIAPPVATGKDKIEVVEFFRYSCPHCFDFEPVLDAWLKKLPVDVRFRRVPDMFSGSMWPPPAARLYYTLEVMGLLGKLHSRVYDAMHVDRVRLLNEDVMFEWAAKTGIDPIQFRKTWSSVEVQDRLRRAAELNQAAAVMAVPAMMIDGRYLVTGMGDYVELLAVTDHLIARVRAERSAGGGRK